MFRPEHEQYNFFFLNHIHAQPAMSCNTFFLTTLPQGRLTRGSNYRVAAFFVYISRGRAMGWCVVPLAGWVRWLAEGNQLTTFPRVMHIYWSVICSRSKGSKGKPMNKATKTFQLVDRARGSWPTSCCGWRSPSCTREAQT